MVAVAAEGKGASFRLWTGALCTLAGTVTGAGFISGRELLEFFGCFRPGAVVLAGALFFLVFLLFLSLGAAYGGFDGAMRAVFGRAAIAAKAAVLFASFVSAAGMLSALDSLFPKCFPALSLAFLAVASAVAVRGIKGIGTASLALIPVTLAAVLFSVLSARALSPPEPPHIPAPFLFNAFLYVFANVVFSLPVLCDLGAELARRNPKKNSRKDRKIPFALVRGFCLLGLGASAVICFFICLILSAVASDKNSYVKDLPLAYVLGGRIFPFVAALGIFVNLISAYAPLRRFACRAGGSTGELFLFVATQLFALVPFGKIVSTVYPVLGVFGAFCVLLSVLRAFRFRSPAVRSVLRSAKPRSVP